MSSAVALPLEAAPSLGEILKHYPVSEMARTFQESTAKIRYHLEAIGRESAAILEAIPPDNGSSYAYQINHSYHYGRGHSESADSIIGEMKREAWRVLVNRIGLRQIMSVKRKKEFDEQLEKGELPDITPETIMDCIMGLCQQAQDFAKEASKEVFDFLRPQNGWGGQYKTNNHFRVGRRVILTYAVEQGYRASGSFRPSHHKEQHLIALDGVFYLLDGKGVMREYRGPLCQAIMDCEGGKGETTYFRFKCFKNRNLHIEFKRLDLVQELNMQAVGERVIGKDME
jgi:hypothetical protein